MATVLQLVGLILLLIAACGAPSGRFGLGWLGLAFWLASIVLPSLHV